MSQTAQSIQVRKQQLEAAVAAKPADSQVNYDLCCFLQYDCDDLTAAAKVAENYLKVNQTIWALHRLCELLPQLGRSEEVVKLAKVAIELERRQNQNGKAGQWIYDRLVDALSRLGRTEDAKQAMVEFDLKDRIDSEGMLKNVRKMTFSEIGHATYILSLQGDHKDVISILTAWSPDGSLYAHDGPMLDRLGTAYFQLGEYTKSAEAYEKSFAMSKSSWIYDKLIRVYEALHNMSRELELCQEYLKIAQGELFHAPLIRHAWNRIPILYGELDIPERAEIAVRLRDSAIKFLEGSLNAEKELKTFEEESSKESKTDSEFDKADEFIKNRLQQTGDEFKTAIEESGKSTDVSSQSNPDTKVLTANILRIESKVRELEELLDETREMKLKVKKIRKDPVLYAYYDSFLFTMQQCYITSVAINTNQLKVETRAANLIELALSLVPFVGSGVGKILNSVVSYINEESIKEKAQNVCSLAPDTHELHDMLLEVIIERIISSAEALAKISEADSELADTRSTWAKFVNKIKCIASDNAGTLAVSGSRFATDIQKLAYLHAVTLLTEVVAQGILNSRFSSLTHDDKVAKLNMHLDSILKRMHDSSVLTLNDNDVDEAKVTNDDKPSVEPKLETSDKEKAKELEKPGSSKSVEDNAKGKSSSKKAKADDKPEKTSGCCTIA